MDVLSEVLRVVRFDGALFFNAEFSSPWCVSSPASTVYAANLSPKAEHLIMYHFLMDGSAFVKLGDGRVVQLTSGDVVFLPHGDPHLLGHGSPEKPVDAVKTFAKNLTEGLKLIRFGGGGEVTRFVCGYLACEPRLSEVFLAGLPKVVVVNVGKEASGR